MVGSTLPCRMLFHNRIRSARKEGEKVRGRNIRGATKRMHVGECLLSVHVDTSFEPVICSHRAKHYDHLGELSKQLKRTRTGEK